MFYTIKQNQMDRSIAPQIHDINHIDIKQVTKETLSNGVELVVLNQGEQDLIKVEVLFEAGIRYQDKPLVATMTNSMLQEGTKNRTSNEINETFDFYGAFSSTEVTKDFSGFQVFVLSKYLDKVLPLVEDCLFNSTFPKKEFDRLLSNKYAGYQVNQGKVEFIARQELGEALFEGGDYGAVVKEEDYSLLTVADLEAFYKKCYIDGKYKVLVSGRLSDADLDLIRKDVESWTSVGNEQPEFKTGTFNPGYKRIVKEGANQSAIRIGVPRFKMDHQDYLKMKVLNTILGGYFGSRLMANIREDKGYTYGIGSALIPFSEHGLFLIASEVGSQFEQDALKEIKFELNRLKEELVPEEELALVKKYMLGNALRSFDGVFDLLERYKEIMNIDKGYAFFDEFIAAINNVSAEELKDLANKYLNIEEMLTIVVGPEETTD